MCASWTTFSIEVSRSATGRPIACLKITFKLFTSRLRSPATDTPRVPPKTRMRGAGLKSTTGLPPSISMARKMQARPNPIAIGVSVSFIALPRAELAGALRPGARGGPAEGHDVPGRSAGVAWGRGEGELPRMGVELLGEHLGLGVLEPDPAHHLCHRLGDDVAGAGREDDPGLRVGFYSLDELLVEGEALSSERGEDDHPCLPLPAWRPCLRVRGVYRLVRPPPEGPRPERGHAAELRRARRGPACTGASGRPCGSGTRGSR